MRNSGAWSSRSSAVRISAARLESGAASDGRCSWACTESSLKTPSVARGQELAGPGTLLKTQDVHRCACVALCTPARPEHTSEKPVMRHFFALISLAAVASAQPVVSHVYNGGNTAGNLCPGLSAIITGSNLGAFGATSVLTVGGQPGQIVQNGSSQVFAIFPANLTPGPTTLTIAYNGQTSAPFAVTLVAYAPGMAQVNSAYFFPICSQCFDLVNIQPPGINAQNPAQPGTEVAALVTGLGATPLGTPAVTVGGQPATLDVVQQDGAQPEFYDVVFTVPNGLSPGGQPTTVSIGGVTSPPETLYIGAACRPSPPSKIRLPVRLKPAPTGPRLIPSWPFT